MSEAHNVIALHPDTQPQRDTERRKLTKSVVAALQPGPEPYITWDRDIPGFGVRVMPSGQKTFILKYRVGRGRGAPMRRPAIGRVGAITAEKARTIAEDWRLKARNGIDPYQEIHQANRPRTVGDMLDDYLSQHVAHHNRESTRSDYQRMRDNDIPASLLRKPLSDVTVQDIRKLHSDHATHPYKANRLAQFLSAAFNYEGMTGERNPARSGRHGVQRYDEQKREQYLSGDQIKAVLKALDEYPNPVSANAIRLIMLTGARKREVLRATWDQFDLERGVWTKPSSHTKQKRKHVVPLSAAAVALLKSMTRTGEYVFPGKRHGTHLEDIKRAWGWIRERAGVPGIRIHDLRHTFASLLAGQGLSLPVIGALLGHTQAATTQRYAHLADDPLREATEKVGKVIGHD